MRPVKKLDTRLLSAYTESWPSNLRLAYTTPPTLAVNNAGANVLITWPVSVSTLFVLQQSSSITGPWANVGTAPTIVNLQNQISVPNSGTKFYRLMLQ